MELWFDLSETMVDCTAEDMISKYKYGLALKNEFQGYTDKNAPITAIIVNNPVFLTSYVKLL